MTKHFRSAHDEPCFQWIFCSNRSSLGLYENRAGVRVDLATGSGFELRKNNAC
jgi:hypothetical protein